MVEVLLRSCSDPSAANLEQETALLQASRRGFSSVVDVRPQTLTLLILLVFVLVVGVVLVLKDGGGGVVWVCVVYCQKASRCGFLSSTVDVLLHTCLLMLGMVLVMVVRLILVL